MLLRLNIHPETPVVATASSTSMESLLPVQLPDEEFKEYVNTFFPRRRPPKGFHTSTAQYYELAVYLTQFSSFLGAMQAFLKEMASETLVNDSETFVKAGPSKFARHLAAASDQGIQAVMVKDYLESLKGKHVIIKSPTGFNINFSGLPGPAGKGTCLSHTVASSVSDFPTTTSSYMYGQFQQRAVADKPTFKAIHAAAQAFLKVITGTTASIETSMNRKINVLPLTFNLQLALERANAAAQAFLPGIDLFGPIKPPRPDPAMVSGLQYLNILVVHEAERQALEYLSRTPTPPPLTADSSPQNAYAPVFNAVLGISFQIRLPLNFAEFITQTPPGKEVPMVPLNTWVNIWTMALMRPPRKKQKGGRINVGQAPRYVLSASQSAVLAERRKALGFFTEPGRINDDGIFTSDTGRFNWCPPSSDLIMDNARNYEALMEEALRLSYEAGTPLNASQVGETSKVFGVASPAYKERIKDIKTKISAYAGSLQTFSWDYNVILTSSSSDPEKLVSYNLAGAAQPNDLSVADYLRQPFAQAMQLLFHKSHVVDEAGNKSSTVTETSFGKGGTITAMLRTSLFVGIYKLYQYLLADKKVPVLQDLVLEAAKELGIKELDAEKAPYDVGLYKSVMDESLSVKPEFNQLTGGQQIEAQSRALYLILAAALKDSSGAPGTNLARVVVKEGVDLKDDEHYFNPEFFTLGEFKNVYSYLGGRVFNVMCNHILRAPRSSFFVLNPSNAFQLPDFQSLVKEIMPAIIILGKYSPQSVEIIERAQVLEEANKRNTSVAADDLKVPGSKASFQIFPHQLKTHQFLLNHPRYAVLDVAPGGGKTITLLTDAANLVHLGLLKTPPCIFAPNGLVKNWVEDMHKVTEGKWNVIPITTSVYRTWGDERLTKLIQNAPRNTIVVMSTSVLRLDKYPVVIGNHVETVSAVLEFARKFGFEYIALDESHRAKNVHTSVHKALKQLMVSSVVKFIRIASGTLIKDRLTDVVGQAALFNAQIFRTAEEYEAENSEQLGKYAVMTWKKDTPKRAREQLAKHAAVITAKKKEWAFMLPRPIETFIPVRLEKPDAEGGTAHQMMYEAILKETLKEIKQDPEVMKLLQGRDEDSDADEDDDDDAPKGPVLDTDLDDATLADLESKLEPYLARLEQLLTDPLGDPFGAVYFKGMSRDNFVSNKVLKCLERIQRNFDNLPWVKGKSYRLKDLADYNNVRYVLMGQPGKKLTLDDYESEYESHITPDKDSRWKPEPMGKVIVFCRYTRSVNAIYRALPPALRKLAVKFHGEVKNKWEGFEEFRKAPFSTTKGVQILIANEQAITEGHNMQMASRIVRMESPWAPGELDQSSSRIFRPDPSKKFSRENVYLDWIISNGTLEVAKMGRLISKMLVKAQFDEADNPLYEPIAELQLPMIRMNLKTLGAEDGSDDSPSITVLDDISDYIQSYASLIHIQASEFEEMRQSGPSTMLDVPPTPMFKGASIIEQVPYVPNLELPDRHNFGLIRLNEYLQDTENEAVVSLLKDKQGLIGTLVHTEFGNGVISRVGLSRVPRDSAVTPEEAEAARRITRIDVKLANGDEYSGDPSMIFLATNVTKANMHDFGPTTRIVTRRDKEIAERARRAEERQAAREAAKADKDAALAAKTSGRRTRRDVAPAAAPNKDITLYPVVYNGFLALEGEAEDPSALDLSDYGFKVFGAYAYAAIKDQVSFTALMDWMKAKFYLAPTILKRLESLNSSFQTGRGRKFAVELAPTSEFKNFYLLRHKLSGKDTRGRSELKVYPTIINGVLILNIDLATNPSIKRYLEKPIPGTRNLKFSEAGSLHIKFFSNRAALVQSVRDLKADGLVVTNFAELKAELAELKTSQRI